MWRKLVGRAGSGRSHAQNLSCMGTSFLLSNRHFGQPLFLIQHHFELPHHGFVLCILKLSDGWSQLFRAMEAWKRQFFMKCDKPAHLLSRCYAESSWFSQGYEAFQLLPIRFLPRKQKRGEEMSETRIQRQIAVAEEGKAYLLTNPLIFDSFA